VGAIGGGEQKILVALAGQWRRRSGYAKQLLRKAKRFRRGKMGGGLDK
jgi:hypothetical protein